MDDLLEMYAGDFGLKYDPKEDTVGPNEAARISQCQPDGYNQGVQADAAAGQEFGLRNMHSSGAKRSVTDGCTSQEIPRPRGHRAEQGRERAGDELSRRHAPACLPRY